MGVWRAFGLSVRSEAEGAYAFGVCSLCLDGESSIGLSIKGISRPIKAKPFDPGTEWHEYRVEFRGARVVCYVDDVEVFNEVETTFLTGTGVGLWASGAALEVSAFEVTRP